MSRLSQIEKGAFIKLFNRSGYVLDFSTNDFDIFTMDCVGVALCQQYQLSKGKSLMEYAHNAQEDDIIKLYDALLAHYEFHYQKEIESGDDYAKLYMKCRGVMDRIKSITVPLANSANVLTAKFSSDYLSAQINLMLEMPRQNPTEAIGKAKEFIESCCRTILEKNTITPDKNWDVGRLVGETVKLLKLTPQNIPDTTPEAESIKSLLGNLRGIASNMATIRNAYGSGHGKSANYKGLEERHAKLAVGSAITLVQFLWDSYEKQLTKTQPQANNP